MSKLEPGLLAARRVAPLACQNAGDMSVLLYLGTFAKRLGSTLGIALQRLVFYLLSTGRSVVQLAVDVRRMLYRSVGWMSASPRSPMLRDLGLRFTLPRWKIFSAGLAALIASAFVRKRIQDRNDSQMRRMRVLKKNMAEATAWHEWNAAASEASKKREAEEEKMYDAKLLRMRLGHLRRVLNTGNAGQLMDAVQADLVRNLANMTNPDLHAGAPKVPELINEFIGEMQRALVSLTDRHDVPLEVKSRFLRHARHTFGRTALVLSGGGALGTFHIGVVKALFENGLLPSVLSGSSVGSIICAIMATRDDAELAEIFKDMSTVDLSFFSNSTTVQFLKHMIHNGVLQDHSVLQKRLSNVLGENTTFEEAYRKTGRILNVIVCAADTKEPPRLLNYLTAPNCIIWSAVACSSAFPGLFKPQDLLALDRSGGYCRFTADISDPDNARRWRDGSLEEDLPMRGLREMFNINYFLCSQTNPHIVPALNIKKHVNRTMAELVELEFKHRCRQLHMVLPDWLPTYWLKVVSQPWEGDVTMVLPSLVWQIKKAISNPTPDELREAVKLGEFVTWSKMSAIKANCAIELTFDECMKKVKAMEEAEMQRGVRRQGMGARIPSYAHMRTAHSMLNIASTASLANASSGDLSSLHQQQQEEGNNEAHGALMAPRDSAAISAEATLTVRTQSGGSDIGPLLAAVFEASDEDDASDNGGGLRQGDAAEAPSRAGTPPLGGGPHRRAPSLWDALSKPDTELRTQQLPFDCCDRSVDINQPIECMTRLTEGGGDGFQYIAFAC